MENIRKIIKEELEELMEVDILRSMAGDHPIFSNPEKAFDYAMEWAEKTNKLRQFHQLVGNVLWNTNFPEEKIEHLKSLYKEYTGFSI
ncbi:MAG: hypothetical protein WED10_09430 [Brumimicrobium sp.]